MNSIFFVLTEGAQQGSVLNILLLYGAVFGVFWFFLIRPQRKKQKEVQQMQNSVTAGDKIITNGGMYGTVVDVVNDVVVVEFGTNKSVRIPLQKAAIAGMGEPDMTVNSVVEEENEEEKTE